MGVRDEKFLHCRGYMTFNGGVGVHTDGLTTCLLSYFFLAVLVFTWSMLITSSVLMIH